MNLEREIEQTLSDAAVGVTPLDPSFEQVERKVRARRARAAVAGSFAGALVIVAVFALMWRAEDEPTFARGEEGRWSEEEVTGVPVAAFRNEAVGYQLALAADWTYRSDGTTVEFRPTALPLGRAGEETMTVTIEHLAGVRFQEDAPGYEPGHEVASRPAVRAVTTEGERHTIIFLVDWLLANCPPTADCIEEPSMLRVTLFGSTDASWDAHSPAADRLVKSIVTTLAAEEPDSAFTPGGGVRYDIAWDEYTRVAVLFLDARMDVGGAEYLTEDAEQDYSRSDSIGLYETKDPARPWSRYQVIDRLDREGEVEFVVELSTEDDFTNTEVLTLRQTDKGIMVDGSAVFAPSGPPLVED